MKILSIKIILSRFNVSLMKISLIESLSWACQLRSGFKSMISHLRFDWSKTPSNKQHFETPFKFFEVIFGPSYGQLNNEGKFLKCIEYLNDNLRQVLTITHVACEKFGDHSRLLVILSPRVFHQHQFSFQFFVKNLS